MGKTGSGEITALCIIQALKYHILLCSFGCGLVFLKWTLLWFLIFLLMMSRSLKTIPQYRGGIPRWVQLHLRESGSPRAGLVLGVSMQGRDRTVSCASDMDLSLPDDSPCWASLWLC